jgi:hypothetical protein
MKTKFLCLFTAAAFLATSSLVRAAVPPAENLLPADTFLFFTVPDCNALRTASKVSPQLMFWNDPAMKPFRDHFMGKLDEKYIAPMEKALGMKVSDFASLPQGQFTFAVTVNGSTGHDDIPPGLLLLLDARDKSDFLKTNLAALSKKWTDAGRAVRTESFHGIPFTVVTISTNDLASFLPQKTPVSDITQPAKPGPKPVDIYIAQYNSLLIVGNSPKVVEPVAAHLTGGNVPSLSDNAIFAADKLAQFRNNPTYYGWFGAKDFFDLLSQAPPDNDSSPFASQFNLPKIFTALGVNGLKSASLALHESHDGSDLAIHINSPENERSGLLKILALPAKDAGIPSFVPADAIKFSRIRLDGKAAWDQIQKTVATISPQGLSSINSAIDMVNTLAQQKDPSFDLRNNLFGNLRDDIINYQKPPLDDSLASLASQPSVTLVAVSNPDQMIQAVRAIASLVARQDPSLAPRDFLGHKIYSIALRPRTLPDGTSVPTKPLLVSSSSSYVAFSMDPGILEEYLRSADGKTTPLNQVPGLADATAHVGGTGGGLFGYQNQRDAMRLVFRAWNNAASSPVITMMPPAVRDWLDFSLLPAFDTVSKYFYISVYSASTDSSGTTLRIFNPRPPQLN